MTESKDLFLEERRQKILKWVEQQQRASVAELSHELGVSEVTIRTDLQALADRQLIIRTHGGAIPATGKSYDLTLSRRQQQQVQAKDRIGRAAAELIIDDDAIFLDSSSTTLAIARHLKQRRRQTIVTNSLAIAQEMLDAPGITVVIPGGIVQREMASLIKLDDLDMLQEYNIQKGFFGAFGLSLSDGLTDASADEAEVKRMFVQRCRQVVALLDTTKWGKVGLAPFAQINEIDTVITDVDAPPEMVKQAKTVGIETILV
jgi:DeoR/GlpR family transcriptional regulator of sugar metabolism